MTNKELLDLLAQVQKIKAETQTIELKAAVQEITEFLGIKSTTYAIKTYVAPLLDSEKLKMTLPEIPKSPRQQYVKN